MTESEAFFEKYCANSGIKYDRIPREETKTPDYWLTIDGQRVVVEIKEIDRNKEEQESYRLSKERGYEEGTNTPGHRVRKKIYDSSAQIKARSQGIYPSILVLFDRGRNVGHLDPYEIRVAMYGLEQIDIKVPINPAISPYATGMRYGPKRKMTEDHNTSISAIGVLSTPGPNEILLEVYHNKFAALPLNPELLAEYGIHQLKLEDEVPGYTAKWTEFAVQVET